MAQTSKLVIVKNFASKPTTLRKSLESQHVRQPELYEVLRNRSPGFLNDI